ncbi:hypothetical protein G1O98_26930 [Nostoc sp. UIC10630]|nr:hypothetical protein [Nostoc sp. UIC 10630]NEU82580.1 hypothetical protein [Nostoc sp. UIC 10630]
MASFILCENARRDLIAYERRGNAAAVISSVAYVDSFPTDLPMNIVSFHYLLLT